jgi:hypothetical protein
MHQEADSAWGAVQFYRGCLRITAACRRARTTIFSFFTLFLLSTVIFGASVLVAPAVAQPNIVVIMTDDQRLDDLQVMTKTKRLLLPISLVLLLSPNVKLLRSVYELNS